MKRIEKNYTYTSGDTTGSKKTPKRIFQYNNRQKGVNARAEQVPKGREEAQNERSEGREIADE